MTILDNSFKEKQDLAIQIELLRMKLDAATEPDEREALEAELLRLEQVCAARWPSDSWETQPAMPAVDPSNVFIPSGAGYSGKGHKLTRTSLADQFPGRSISQNQPSVQERRQAAAWQAIHDGQASLQQAQKSSGETAKSLFQDAMNKFASAGKLFQECNVKSGAAAAHALLGTAHKGRADLFPPEASAKEAEKAAGHLMAALEFYTEADQPNQWADVNFNLGEALMKIPEPVHFKNAAAAFQAALRVYKPETNHEFWSKSLANFGIAVGFAVATGSLPRTWTKQSVAACRQALGELDARFPICRAYTASTLGQMLVMEANLEVAAGSGAIDVAAHLEDALCSLDDALNTFTETAYPAEWAEIQSTKASALLHKARRSPADEASSAFSAAIETAKAALRIIKADDPVQGMAMQLTIFQAHRALATSDGCEDVGRELNLALESADAVLPLLGPENEAFKAQLVQQRAELCALKSAL